MKPLHRFACLVVMGAGALELIAGTWRTGVLGAVLLLAGAGAWGLLAWDRFVVPWRHDRRQRLYRRTLARYGHERGIHLVDNGRVPDTLPASAAILPPAHHDPENR